MSSTFEGKPPFFDPLAPVPMWITRTPIDAWTLRRFIIAQAITITEENGDALDCIPLSDLTGFYEIITGRPFYRGGKVNQ